MPELRRWVGSLEGGGGPQGVPQTPRTLMPGGGGGSGSARLQALVGAAGSRPLDPLMQQLLEGTRVMGIPGVIFLGLAFLCVLGGGMCHSTVLHYVPHTG